MATPSARAARIPGARAGEGDLLGDLDDDDHPGSRRAEREPPVAPPARRRDRRGPERHEDEDECQRARRRAQEQEGDGGPHVAGLERPERAEPQARSEHERVLAGEDRARREDGERGGGGPRVITPAPPDQVGEGGRRARGRGDQDRREPERRRGGGEDQGVADLGVAAAVPQVVPGVEATERNSAISYRWAGTSGPGGPQTKRTSASTPEIAPRASGCSASRTPRGMRPPPGPWGCSSGEIVVCPPAVGGDDARARGTPDDRRRSVAPQRPRPRGGLGILR